jgi:two-component system sensor histidine kinase KdpD
MTNNTNDANNHLDQLIDQLTAEQNTKNQKKGKLTIFLGAAPGVGKTYRMLTEVHMLLSNKEDVVIGYIETHGRADVIKLLIKDIEYIPLRLIDYNNNTGVTEFDIDAALERNPKIIIIDELAHTNAVGSRNTRRYQDVLELLNANIDVYTALNIQHVDSLKNIIERITNSKITETVPDYLIEIADQIILIDLPSDELIKRIADGKVYKPESIDHALNNFFRKGNLIALRDLALRKIAKKVNLEVIEYRHNNKINTIWSNNDRLLLILEPGYSSDVIVRHAKREFDKDYTKWFVAYIENYEFKNRTLKEKQDIIDLIDLAKQFGATPVQLVGNNHIDVIKTFVNENNINHIIFGRYKTNLWYKLFGKSLVDKLMDDIPGINIHLVTDEINLNYQTFKNTNTKNIDYYKFLKKILSFATIFTILGLLLHPLVNWVFNENLLLVYILVMMTINKSRGKTSAVMIAL